MGQYYEYKDGQVHVYVGPEIIDGQPFNGNEMRNPDGTKSYGHYGSEPGSEQVGLFRPPGVPGEQSPHW